jgi:subtilisin family serine protease
MSRLIITISILLYSVVCNSQTHSDTIKLVQSGNALFVVKGNNSFEINQKVITVKPKMPNWAKDRYKIIRSNILGYYDISVPEGESVEEYYDVLKQTGEFDLVKYNTFYSYCSTPNDYHVGDQWYLGTINAFNAWDLTMGSPAIKVAVIDSGIDVTHEDLGYGNDSYSNINLLYGYNTISDDPHGTIIAGIIGAKANNSIGIAGIAGGNHAEGTTIYSYYVGAVQPDGSLIDDAIIDAVNDGVNIIQMSLEGDYSQDIREAIDYAYEQNVSVICCSGKNTSNSISSPLLFPACYDRVITVGGTNYNNERLTFSRYGDGLDLVAPGIDIISTTNTPISHLPYFSYAGTSFAAPQVTGVVALMLSINPNLTPDQIRTILHNTAYKIPLYSSCYNNNGWCDEVGYGLLDAYAAVLAALQINITGSDPLCGEEIYTISGIPAGASVSLGTNTGGFWIQKSGNISFDSYNSTTGELSVQQTTPGNGYIKVYYDDHLLATKEFWVGGPEITNFYYMGNTLYAEASTLSFYWNINGTTFWSREGRKYYPLADGTYNVSVYAVIPNCGAGPTYTTQLHVSGGNMYSLGAISSDHQVSIEPIDYSNSPQPLEAMQTMTTKRAAKDVPYELKNAMTGEVSARGEMPAEGGVIDFSRVRSGLYVLTLSPAGREPETFKISLK